MDEKGCEEVRVEARNCSRPTTSQTQLDSQPEPAQTIETKIRVGESCFQPRQTFMLSP
jgi:hypothetical protein